MGQWLTIRELLFSQSTLVDLDNNNISDANFSSGFEVSSENSLTLAIEKLEKLH